MSLRWWEPTGERRSTFDCFVTTQHGHRVVTPRMRGQTDYPGQDHALRASPARAPPVRAGQPVRAHTPRRTASRVALWLRFLRPPRPPPWRLTLWAAAPTALLVGGVSPHVQSGHQGAPRILASPRPTPTRSASTTAIISVAAKALHSPIVRCGCGIGAAPLVQSSRRNEGGTERNQVKGHSRVHDRDGQHEDPENIGRIPRTDSPTTVAPRCVRSSDPTITRDHQK